MQVARNGTLVTTGAYHLDGDEWLAQPRSVNLDWPDPKDPPAGEAGGPFAVSGGSLDPVPGSRAGGGRDDEIGELKVRQMM